MDFLSTFLDESVHADESAFLFEKTLERTSFIAQFAPVVVSVKPLLSISAERAGLLDRLRSRAAHYWEELPVIAETGEKLQPTLFEGF
jgi:hypothetical protein